MTVVTYNKWQMELFMHAKQEAFHILCRVPSQFLSCNNGILSWGSKEIYECKYGKYDVLEIPIQLTK